MKTWASLSIIKTFMHVSLRSRPFIGRNASHTHGGKLSQGHSILAEWLACFRRRLSYIEPCYCMKCSCQHCHVSSRQTIVWLTRMKRTPGIFQNQMHTIYARTCSQLHTAAGHCCTIATATSFNFVFFFFSTTTNIFGSRSDKSLNYCNWEINLIIWPHPANP